MQPRSRIQFDSSLSSWFIGDDLLTTQREVWLRGRHRILRGNPKIVHKTWCGWLYVYTCRSSHDKPRIGAPFSSYSSSLSDGFLKRTTAISNSHSKLATIVWDACGSWSRWVSSHRELISLAVANMIYCPMSSEWSLSDGGARVPLLDPQSAP